MRRSAALLLLAVLTCPIAVVATAGDDLGITPSRTARARREQYDAEGRLVFAPGAGRRVFDDRARGLLRARGRAATRAVAHPSGTETRLLAGESSAATTSLAGGSLRLERTWYNVVFGVGIGAAGLHIADLDGDGQPEIVAAAGTYGFSPDTLWYVLSPQGSSFVQTWVSLPYPSPITSLQVAQLDADAALEVLVAMGSQVLIYDGATHALEKTISTAAQSIEGLTVADVDGNGTLDLVFCDSSSLFVYDAASGALEFQGSGLGGVDVAVGQLDTDPALEIVVGNGTSPGFVVDGASHAVEWTQPSGFGHLVRVADLDGDGHPEIVAGFAWSGLTVYHGDSHGLAYTVPIFNLAAVRIADVEGDGPLEVVYGDAQWGDVHVLNGATGAEKWSLDNPEHGVTDVAVGDVDGDGVADVIWGAGYSSTGADHLYVADSVTRIRKWESPDRVGPFYALDFGDVDGDGAQELLYSSFESDSGYSDGSYSVRDAATKALEYESGPVLPSNFMGIWRVRSANVDDDPQREIFVGSGDGYTGIILAFDGLTHEEQWRVTLVSGLEVTALQVADVDGDGRLELVAAVGKVHSGAPGQYVYVFDAATGALEWQSPSLGSGWPTLSLLRMADLNDDGRPEIVVANWGGELYVLDAVARTVRLTTADLDITALETPDRDGDGRAEILVGTASGKIERLDPATGAVAQILGDFEGQIDGLAVVDLTGDGVADLVFGLADRLRVADGASGTLLFSSEVLGSGVGAQDSLFAADLDGDGTAEVVVNVGGGLMAFTAVVTPDTIPPSVAITAPSEGALVSGVVPIVASASDDFGVTVVEFYLDGALLGSDPTPAPYAFYWNTGPVAPGPHALTAKAKDAAGNTGTSGVVNVTVKDVAAPSVLLTSPTNGSVVLGTVSIAATASDNVGVTRVEFYVDGVFKGSDVTSPYAYDWNTTTVANGSHFLSARAYDAAANVGYSGSVTVTVDNAGATGNAVYDATYRVPRCSSPASFCDSGALLNGRASLGPETHQPNTIFGSCADGTAGTYHADESNDRLRVSTLDGSPLAPGKTVRIEATVWAWSVPSADKLDLYSAASASNPVWTLIATLSPTSAGAQVLSTLFTLPAGADQAVRARFRYQGSPAPCGAGSYNDHDDLVFAAGTADLTPPSATILSPADGSTVGGTVSVQVSASDNVGVTRVEFHVDGGLKFTDATAPWAYDWSTVLYSNGSHTVLVKAFDAAGNVGTRSVTVTVQNYASGNAVFDPVLRAPGCASVDASCDSGVLLFGRGPVGPEPNQPNTLASACADGALGTFHVDESLDRLLVSTLDGTPLAAGKTVRLEAAVWAWAATGDSLDLYYSASAASPTWVPIATLPATVSGAQILSATYVLPPGGLQAVRGHFRYQGTASTCSGGGFDDHDDLAFAVQ